MFDWSQIRTNGSFEVLDAPWDEINVHVRSGSIVPMQEYALTTALTRKTPFTLLVAIDSHINDLGNSEVFRQKGDAYGELFVDNDGEIEMVVKAGTSTFVEFEAFQSQPKGALRGFVTHGH